MERWYRDELRFLGKSIQNTKSSINYIRTLVRQDGPLLQHILLNWTSEPKSRGVEFIPLLVKWNQIKESVGRRTSGENAISPSFVSLLCTLLMAPEDQQGRQMVPDKIVVSSRAHFLHLRGQQRSDLRKAGENKMWFESH